MFLRFATRQLDERTGRPTGIFTVAYNLLDDGQLSHDEENELRTILNWFSSHMPLPTKFSRNRNGSHKNTPGISWIRSTATDAVSEIWNLKKSLERHGIVIDVFRTAHPGRIVYEDETQVIAEPFHQELQG